MKLFSKIKMHELTVPRMLEHLLSIIQNERDKRERNLKRAAKNLQLGTRLKNKDNIFKIKFEDKYMAHNSMDLSFSLDRWKQVHKLEFDYLKHNWRLRIYYNKRFFLFKFRRNIFWEQYAEGESDQVSSWTTSSKFNVIYDEQGIANNYIDFK